jgi:hypothetical protein
MRVGEALKGDRVMNITVEEVEGLYRRAGLARHSLLASLAGYLAGATVLAGHYVPGLTPFDKGWGSYVAELIFSFSFSGLGCLIFILPIAAAYRVGRWTDQAWLVALLGSVIGAAMLTPVFGLFFEQSSRRVDPVLLAYGLSAVVNAATASWSCVYLRRRHQQRFRTFLRRNGDSILEGL